MLSQERDDKIMELTEDFVYYVKKVRGYVCMPCGIQAVIIWYEFKNWQEKRSE